VPASVPTEGNRTIRSYAYTRFGEVARVDECVDGQVFTTEYGYDDAHGRQDRVTYPHAAGMTLATQYHYTKGGALYAVSDLGAGSLLWAASAVDAMGQVSKEQTSNGVETVTVRNPSRGWVRHIGTTAVADNHTVIQQRDNDYDEAGNLRPRERCQTPIQKRGNWAPP
jgi:hypothetical protein